jgi:hypothetical protein
MVLVWTLSLGSLGFAWEFVRFRALEISGSALPSFVAVRVQPVASCADEGTAATVVLAGPTDATRIVVFWQFSEILSTLDWFWKISISGWAKLVPTVELLSGTLLEFEFPGPAPNRFDKVLRAFPKKFPLELAIAGGTRALVDSVELIVGACIRYAFPVCIEAFETMLTKEMLTWEEGKKLLPLMLSDSPATALDEGLTRSSGFRVCAAETWAPAK